MMGTIKGLSKNIYFPFYKKKEVCGYLRQVQASDLADDRLIADLSKWRNKAKEKFFTVFNVTEQGTRNWLNKKFLQSDKNLLFLAEDENRRVVGHIGLLNVDGQLGEAEIDSVLRGEKVATPGFFRYVLQALVSWGKKELFLRRYYLSVFQDNLRAISLYKELGFRETAVYDTVKEERGGIICYVPAQILSENSAQTKERKIISFCLDVNRKRLNEVENEKIFVSGPSITQKEMDYVLDAVQNAWYGQANLYHERFEQAFAAYIGVKYAMALPSCTSAIHLSLLAKGIKSGDEVLVPELTWIATAAPISYVGAVPVFVDVDEQSWCISPKAIEAAVTKKTKAIISVNLYGNMPQYDEIRKIAQKYGLFLLEDAAESIGSEYNGRKSGSLGDVGVFSFHGSKTMTTGEGGMLVTDDRDIYEKCLFFRDHGRSKDGRMFWNDRVAYKYKMSSMQAALGLAQLERIDELVEKKRRIFSWYKNLLGENNTVTLNSEAENVKNTYWMVTAIFAETLGVKKEEVIAYLDRENISTRPIFYPLSMLPAYKGLPPVKNNVAYALSPYGINLPCGMDMDEEKVGRVVDVFLGCLDNLRK